MSSNQTNVTDTGLVGLDLGKGIVDELGEFLEGDPDDWDEEKLKRFDQAVEDRKAARGKVRSRKAAIKSLLHQGATMKRTASMKVRRAK